MRVCRAGKYLFQIMIIVALTSQPNELQVRALMFLCKTNRGELINVKS